MWGFVNTWYFWAFVVIIILIILWVVTKCKTGHDTGRSASFDSNGESKIDCSRDEYEYVKKRKIIPRSRKRPSRNVGSRYDSLPDYDMIDEVIACHQSNNPHEYAEIDLTPDIPGFIYDEPSAPKKQSIGEKECKRVIEEIYGVPFQTQLRPDWLLNPLTGRKMELDLYNEDLKLAIEYNGRQHYVYTPFFHSSIEKFRDQVKRDHSKIDICDGRGVYVITVPYNVPVDKIEKFIRYNLPDAVRAREARVA